MDRWIITCSALAVLSCGLVASGATAAPLTVLHTNDIHSHFKAEKGGDRLGGVARLKTQIERIRRVEKNTVLLDGGDWAEGNTYYLAGAGRKSIEIMSLMGYDAAVVGNHDWINGPDALLNSINFDHGIRLLSANIDATSYTRRDELHRFVRPMSIQEVGGIKIAYLGVSTYEIIYDTFFKPVKVLSPFGIIHDLSKSIRESGSADVIVAISHNGLKLNQELAEAAPHLDLIIGAHDHVKLLEPITVLQPDGRKTWIVEAGKWAKYLGRVDLEINTDERARSGRRVEFQSYQIYPIDSSIPEDPEIARFVDELDTEIENSLPWLPSEHVTSLTFPIGREGAEPLMGNLATDAYRLATGAEIALDNIAFIYGSLYEGDVTKRDVFDSNPAVWNPEIEKAWTLHRFSLKGRTLLWLLNLFYSHSALINHGLLNHSGLNVVFEPAFTTFSDITIPGEDMLPLPMDPRTPLWSLGRPVVREVRVQDRILDLERTYRVVAPTGVIQAIRFIDRIFPGMIPLKDLEDTRVESWRAISTHLESFVTPRPQDIPMGRSHTTGMDLAFLESYTQINETSAVTRVQNLGQTPSRAPFRVRLEEDQNEGDESVTAKWRLLSELEISERLNPKDSKDVVFENVLPLRTGAARRKLRLVLQTTEIEARTRNNLVERVIFKDVRVK